MTTEAVRNREKTVTRRLGWEDLKPGDLFVPVRQAMGLRKGQKHAVLWPLCRCVATRRERLDALLDRTVYSEEEAELEMTREGFPGMDPAEFVRMFAQANRCLEATLANRIEFEYVEGGDD